MQLAGILHLGERREVGVFDFAYGGLALSMGSAVRRFEDDSCICFIEGQMYDPPLDGVPGMRALESAYGHYCYVRIMKGTGAIDIGTDRLGYYPLYYSMDDERLVFGSSLAATLPRLADATVNYDAWEELFILGDIIGDKTVVNEVQRLSSGMRIAIRNKRVDIIRFWSPELPETVDIPTYVRDNNRLLAEAMALTASQRRDKVVLLSGGEDSRRIAAAAVEAGLEPSFHTQEASHRHGLDIDTGLAREVARALGCRLSIEPLPSCAQHVIDWKARDALLGFECIAHEWLLPLVRSIRRPAIVYDGIVGDVSINGHYFKLYPDVLWRFNETTYLAQLICGDLHRPWLTELRARTSGDIRDRVAELLASYPASPHRMSFYFLLNHTRRKIALVSQFFARNGQWTCYPFMYYPLLVQSLAAEPQQQLARSLQRECLAATSPRLAALPTTRGDVPALYCTDLTRQDRVRRRALRRELFISDEAFEVFPSLRAKYRLLDKVRSCGGEALLDRYGWFLEPVSRFSAFLDWLKTMRQPSSPATTAPSTVRRPAHA